MKQSATTTFIETGAGGPRATTVGILTMAAGALFAVGALASVAVDWAWFAILIGFAALVYVVPQMHRIQSPADGWAGRAGSLLVAAGAGLVVALGVVFLVLEVIGDPGEPVWAGVLWMVGFFAFLAGIVLFAVGSLIGKAFPPGAPLLMLIGLLAAVAIDVATGAFFGEDPDATEWGFHVGVPLFGLGLAWMGHALANTHTSRRPEG